VHFHPEGFTIRGSKVTTMREDRHGWFGAAEFCREGFGNRLSVFIRKTGQ